MTAVSPDPQDVAIRPSVLYIGTPVVLVSSLNPDGGANIPGTHQIDTARWSPLLYVFRRDFGTGPDLGRTFKAEA